jgi:hypothetical protein
MVNLNPFKKTIPVQREAVTAAHGLVRKEANKGQVTSSSNQWTDKQPHPANHVGVVIPRCASLLI